MTETIVSVIIPTYKPKAYLWNCIDSICRQTIGIENIELLIVVNGCGEEYVQSIKDYLSNKSDIKVHLLHTDVAGVSNARNIGIDIANGKFLCFIDDDDWISDNYLETLVAMAGDNADVVEANVCDYIEDTDTYKDDYLTKAFMCCQDKSDLSLMQARKFMSSACCKIIRRSVVGKARFDCRFSIGEDSLFMATISRHIKKICVSFPEAIYYRRVRTGSASRKKDTLWVFVKRYSRLAKAYTKLLLSDVTHYNWLFFATRYVALCIHVLRKS
ncbi:glycosyltransferase family 2 protein [Prevotella sp.]|uniref:glycosyltransferase family 2 protein n=1 Tax=Prevotella sp. TaxID=59823 RepID=UPI00307A40BF